MEYVIRNNGCQIMSRVYDIQCKIHAWIQYVRVSMTYASHQNADQPFAAQTSIEKDQMMYWMLYVPAQRAQSELDGNTIGSAAQCHANDLDALSDTHKHAK
eukprot:333922_1